MTTTGGVPAQGIGGVSGTRPPAADPWRGDASAFPADLPSADFPMDGPPREQLRHALRLAVLAPSGHNTQPWRFILRDRSVDLRADRERCLSVVDPDGRELVMSCGAALGHLRVALDRHGLEHAVVALPDPRDADLLARVHLTGGTCRPDDATPALYDAIPRRRTTRRPFEDRMPAPHDLMACAAAALAEGARLHLVTAASELETVAALVADGDRTQMRDPAFRAELARWIKSRRGPGHDGVSGADFGMPDLLSPLGALAVRTVDMGDGVAEKDMALAAAGPVLGLLTTPSDTVADWLTAGQALSRALLTLTARGMTAAFLNGPVEVATLRPRLRAALHVDGVPQLLLRIGYGPSLPPSVRRPIEDVLTEA